MPALIGYAVALLTAAVLVNRLGSYAYLLPRRVSPELMPPRVNYTVFIQQQLLQRAEMPPSRCRVLLDCVGRSGLSERLDSKASQVIESDNEYRHSQHRHPPMA